MLGRVEAEQSIQPGLHAVARAVPNGRGQRELPQSPRTHPARLAGGLGGGSPAFLMDLAHSLLILGPHDGGARGLGSGRHRRPLLGAQLVDELEGEGASGALVAVDRRAQEHEVGAEQALDHGQGDRRRLVDGEELGLSELGVLVGKDVFDRLPVVLEDVDLDNDLALLADTLM